MTMDHSLPDSWNRYRERDRRMWTERLKGLHDGMHRGGLQVSGDGDRCAIPRHFCRIDIYSIMNIYLYAW